MDGGKDRESDRWRRSNVEFHVPAIAFVFRLAAWGITAELRGRALFARSLSDDVFGVELEITMITGGFGMTMDLERGTARQWVMGRDGVKRWADNGDPCDDGYPADADEPMTVGLDCCPHMVPYGSDCDECDEDDADMAMGLTPNGQGEPGVN